MEYTHYTGKPDEDMFIHGDKHCSLLDELWGDMTENAAIRAIDDPDDLDACPRCCDL